MEMYTQKLTTIPKGTRWEVGNGTNINFWLDSRCANDDLANMVGISGTMSIGPSFTVYYRKYKMGYFSTKLFGR